MALFDHKPSVARIYPQHLPTHGQKHPLSGISHLDLLLCICYLAVRSELSPDHRIGACGSFCPSSPEGKNPGVLSPAPVVPKGCISV